jgi:hypothetical protein
MSSRLRICVRGRSFAEDALHEDDALNGCGRAIVQALQSTTSESPVAKSRIGVKVAHSPKVSRRNLGLR